MTFKRKKHQPKCPCDMCAAKAAGLTQAEALAAQRKWEAAQMKKHGWYAHLIGQDAQTPSGFCAHTHGLQQLHDHPDFQIIVPLPGKVVMAIMHSLADRVKTGERFAPGQVVEKIIVGRNNEPALVKMVLATESERPVLRVVLPDPHGKLDLGEIEPPYDDQYLTTP